MAGKTTKGGEGKPGKAKAGKAKAGNTKARNTKAGAATRSRREKDAAAARSRREAPLAPPPVATEKGSSLLRWLNDRRITEVECLVPDMTGNARGKIIPAAKSCWLRMRNFIASCLRLCWRTAIYIMP